MPLYEYHCPKCGCTTEAIRHTDDRDRHLDCPKCYTGMCRVISPAELRFRGDGWQTPRAGGDE